MHDSQRNQVPGPLRRAAERFERWRQTHERGTHIPKALWTLAAKLAASYGVSKTAQALKLDYYSLKKRLAERALAAAPALDEQPAFLDLSGPALAAGPGACLIEFENASGSRMRVQLQGSQLPDLAALAPVDFRKGIDGLVQLCQATLEQDPFSGAVFAFRNRRSTAVKVLVYDGQGFWLCQKRLSRGRFGWWPTAGKGRAAALAAHELQVLLAAGNPQGVAAPPDWRPIRAG